MHTPRPQKMTFWLFFLAVVTQRLSLIPGTNPVPVALAIYAGAALLVCVRREVVVRRGLLLSVLGVGCILIGTSICTGREFSANSLIYLLVLYLPFSFVVPGGAPLHSTTADGYRWFSNMMCVFAAVALYQYGSQAFLHIPYSDPLGGLPKEFMMSNYEVSYPIQYGSEIYKSNAYVFLEPSFLSQFLALALLIEVMMFRRVTAIAMQIVALATTFSGTGLLFIAITLPFAIIANLHNRRAAILAGLAVVAIVATVASNPAVLKRSGEINDQGSSASIRFSTPYERMRELAFEDASSMLIGYGAGNADRIRVDDRVANFPAIPKAIIEYGLIGGIPLLLLIMVRIFTGIESLPIAVGLFCMQFFLSGALLQPISVFTLFYFFAVQSSGGLPQTTSEAGHVDLAGG
ncbi:hypothetical protein [Paraburkholderia youngii]|uniref:O-antigen ligase domain-containing protein n=1 Tax=Paraburkholderia youngii TaxID=2782701 RepID=A0A7W8LAA5_9BURK|nr:hypothetical protein [Paraburkholderia youngii]MBB5403370.1 hypothetical protein [Paraburkholderia youngii]